MPMREVFNLPRTGAYWWGLVTFLVFLVPAEWIKGVANLIRTVDWFRPDRIPFVWLEILNKWIDEVAQNGIRLVKFDAQALLVYIGPLPIPNLFLAIFLGALLLVIAFVFYRKALATRGVFDDALAMIIIYILLRVEGNAAELLNLPIIEVLFRRLEPRTYLATLSIFLLLLLIGEKGAQDSRAFFKVLAEGTIIWLLILPAQTAQALAGVIDLPAIVSQFLHDDPAVKIYFPIIAAGWGSVGAVAIFINLYTAGKPAPTQKGVQGELAEIQEGINDVKRKLGV